MSRHLLVLALVASGCTSSPSADQPQQHRDELTSGDTFEQWKARYLSAEQTVRARLEAEGVRLAEQRREGFRGLLLNDPERAIELAVTPVEREVLPASVTRHLEQWRDGVGTLHVVAGVGAEDAPPALERFVTFNGLDEVLRAGVFGARLNSATRENVRLHGVSLDGAIALTDRRLRRLFPGEARTSLPVELPRACPVSRKARRARAGVSRRRHALRVLRAAPRRAVRRHPGAG